MILDDFKPNWQQAEFSSVRFDELAASVKQQTAKFESTIFWRDLQEIIAAVIVIAAFSCMLLLDFPALCRVGMVIIILGAAGVIIVLLRASRCTPAQADLPLRGYCQTEQQRVEQQIYLLRHVVVWYLAPIGIGILLIIFGLPLPVVLQAITGAAAILFCWVIHRANQAAVQKYLKPLRDSIAAVVDECDRDASEAPQSK